MNITFFLAASCVCLLLCARCLRLARILKSVGFRLQAVGGLTGAIACLALGVSSNPSIGIVGTAFSLVVLHVGAVWLDLSERPVKAFFDSHSLFRRVTGWVDAPNSPLPKAIPTARDKAYTAIIGVVMFGLGCYWVAFGDDVPIGLVLAIGGAITLVQTHICHLAGKQEREMVT